MKNFKMKNQILISTYIVVLAFLLLNIHSVLKILGQSLSVFKPFIIGIAIAFLINIPMKCFEKRLITPLLKKSRLKNSKIFARILSLLLTLIILFVLISSFVNFVIPQLVKSTSSLVSGVPQYIDTLQSYATNYFSHIKLSDSMHTNILSGMEKLSNFVVKFANYFISNILGITFSITSAITNFLIGFIIAIYILLSKEKLLIQCKKVTYAFLSEKNANRAIDVSHLVCHKFSRFIAGQCTDGVILGTLCFIGMSIFKMPYALLVSTLIAIADLIPIFGTFIGTAIAAFIIFMVKPITALYFIIMIVVIQQIEGNLVYPFVVGNSIGLSSFWILVPIFVGSSTFGVLGIIIGVPLFSVIYTLASGYINKRLEDKNIHF
ncbi:permease [[Clostridium] sordellii]|uniref:Membrane protein n=1 Tax=Paraclostridium sordellii TaxID=1505 RepID=A0ABM9RSS5_PARSO|nr:AI-2E family transporter [Paeniclostridium sordellii]TAN69604.1 AI-2E family transporter [Paeniclostridium sordellii 8483]CEJ75129.1 putative membrane protein [[Clostridium] sordellii] [Paeniclostridium sordellii]CEK32273.1 permease [[Clostridium] sordellii] [Paeniclostridium sordellii]CEN70898.1 permease [[Clostridium] sordellii] [Paeniclostridium sordellii]CEN74189.1 permease [[Clostridium] sordellii] [Paeniclostridium sordellii]